MSDRFDALALPPHDPYMALPYGSGYGMPPPHGPHVLWRLTRRHWKVLLACMVVSLGVAYVAGKFLVKPLWQAEATLLYQPISYSEKQKAAYEHPPSLPTLASWIKDPGLLRQLIDEFQLDVSEEKLAQTYIKVEQPATTESIVVAFKWPDRDLAAPILNRLLELYADYVATIRKELIVLRIEKMDQQAAVACEDNIHKLDEKIKRLTQKLAEFGKLFDDDMDGNMLAHKFTLEDDARKLGQKAAELTRELRAKREDYDSLKPVVELQAAPKTSLKSLADQIAQLELQIANAEALIDAAKEQLRTLPIVLAKAKRNEEADKLKWLKEQLKQHAAARAAIGTPGGPPARGALEGMDAHEFSIKPARVAEKPASSSGKALSAVTFLGLMAGAFGLLYVHDRRHPAPEEPRSRPRMVYVTPPPGSTLYGADVHRLSARIHEWVRENRGPIVTPPPEAPAPPVIIAPDGKLEDKDPSPATNGDAAHEGADTDLLAQRMQNWLGNGHSPG